MALPGQAARTGALASEPSRGRPATWLGLQERRQQDRVQSATLRFPGRERPAVSWTLPFTEVLLPRSEVGRD